MQWFKHDSNASTDAKLERLRIRYGLEGYGLYWYLVELIASNIEPHNFTFELEHDAEIISHRCNLHVDHVNEIMTYMVELKLFENLDGQITCLKLLKRLDTSMTSNPQLRKLITSAKGHHDAIMTPSSDSHDPVMPDKKDKKDKKGPKKLNGAKAPLPENLNLEAWNDFVDHRKAIRKPLTEKAKTLQLNKLKNLSLEKQRLVIDKTIASGWTDLFIDKFSADAGKPKEYV